MKKAVVLLSGGLDSATCLALARQQGYHCHALSFDYGQRHRAELHAAKRVADDLGAVAHHIFPLSLAQLGGSALTDTAIAVPDYQGGDTIPVTYVPARNSIFLSIALAFAETLVSQDIFIGVSAVDYSGYPDCRPEFIAAFTRMANLATKAAVDGQPLRIHAPLMPLSKAETIRTGQALGVNYRLTVSCYQATDAGQACGRCDSCVLRRQGFVQAGYEDATVYQLPG
ncbi:MAG: 7-cyano-7-deazaguanine synthase QueC [Legionellaceae bacterium]|nr:7-cyano-7-deazaguanine synthase QueC [Legionellaceae bacterium]